MVEIDGLVGAATGKCNFVRLRTVCRGGRNLDVAWSQNRFKGNSRGCKTCALVRCPTLEPRTSREVGSAMEWERLLLNIRTARQRIAKV